jgi:endonuclease I/chitodextrinase/endonuclease/exonuclease/phosphatase family metal-dependent hydrolase
MKHFYLKRQSFLVAVFSFLGVISFAQVPSYYNGTNISQNGNTLKTNLATLISRNTINLSYTPGVWDALKQTDLDPTDPTKVLLIYGFNDSDTDITNDRTRGKDNNGGNQGNWNREHVYPRSLGNPNLGSEGPGSDAHHLRSSDITLNAIRNNYPFGPGSGNSKLINGTSFYPGDEWKGDVARMVMYMYVRYGIQCLPNVVAQGSNTFSPDIPDLLLQWNVEDPVSQFELNRNIILEGVQGNRNPFIDNPAFATAIWGGPQAQNRFNGSVPVDTEVPTAPATLFASNTTATGTSLTWTQSTDNVGVLGYRIFNGSVQIASSSAANYVLTGLTSNTNYNFSVKAFDAAGNISSSSNNIVVKTLEGTPPPTPTTSVVFINEIHYDNLGTDVGEGVEIAGTAGTDLTGWSIIPYNGNGGASYAPIGTLSGVIPNQSNAFGTVFVAMSGLQNGAPDGIALVDATGKAIQFLSYEGVFPATNGPANGITSTDIGVLESGSDASGLSLQLKGTGTKYSDFTWQAVTASTYGAINNGQSFSTVTIPLTAPANVVASNLTQTAVTLTWDSVTSAVSYEIYNGTTQVATTTNNTFILNNLTANTEYSFTIVALDANDNASEASAVLSVKTLANTTPVVAGSVFINEIHYDNAGSDVNEGVEIAGLAGVDLTGWKIIPYNGSNGASYTPIGLLSGIIPNQLNGYGTTFVAIPGLQNGAPDGLALVDAENKVVQFLSYEGSFTATNGPAVGIKSTDIGIAQASTETVGNSLQLIGRGTKYSDFTWEAAVSTSGKINKGQRFGDLVFINEIHYDNAGTDVDEGIEVAGYAGIDLTGYSLIPYNGNGGVSYTPVGNLSGIIADQLNGYGTVFVPIFNLQNGSPDGIALVDPTGKVIQFLSYEGSFTATNGPASGITSTDIGIIQAANSPVGTSLQLTGAGFVYADFTWQAATATSNAINKGQFFGNASDIIVVLPIAEARAKTDGEIVTVTGTLTVSDQFAGSAYVQDTTGAIAVFDRQVHGTGLFKIGDSVTITGTKSTFTGQVQISPVRSVTNNGVANQLIEPKTITLNEMVNHPGELVRIVNTTFPKPGAIMFGNSSINITDASGTAQLRLDADVKELTGFAQPENCEEIIGIVSNFFEFQQVLPRMRTDFPCATKYEQSGSDLAISKDKTLDVATWNVAWFGDETNSPAKGNPNSDAIQKEAIKNVLSQLDADIYAVQEVSDDVLFAQMVSEMNDYSFVLSEATSYPSDNTGPKQKVGFVYKNKTVKPVKTRVLLETIHPVYNGGSTAALANYPDADKSRFYASGRLPFMFIADVTIGGDTKQINLINLHARANTSGGELGKYDMRKFDVEVLKDTLDAQYPTANLILLGDYNDDVDFTVSNVSTTVSTYEAYVNDSANYRVVTQPLSAQGFRSYATFENMIDHITVSNELSDLYIDGSARVHYEFFDANYTKTASDHFPVSTRLQLKAFTADTTSITNVTCKGEENGTAMVAVSGGIGPYIYSWSNGATTSTASGLTAGQYNVIITDVLNNKLTATVTITEPTLLSIPSSATATVYYGYTKNACTTLSAGNITGGVLPYTYKWSNGATTQSIAVCPTTTTIYTLVVTDANGCVSATEKTVNVIDVSCGNNPKNPKVEVCHNGKTICIDENAVASHLEHGDTLGSCSTQIEERTTFTDVLTYPNPFVNTVNVTIDTVINVKVDLAIYNFSGQLIQQTTHDVKSGNSDVVLLLSNLQKGNYFLKTIVNGKVKDVKHLIKK